MSILAHLTISRILYIIFIKEVIHMANTYGEKGFMSYMTWQDQAQELTESKYNLIIGAALTWGFGLNYLMMQFFGPAIVNWVYGYGALPFVIGYIVLVLIGSHLVRSFSPARCFIGYNLIAVPVGMVAVAASMFYDPTIVVRAVLCTAIVTLSMMILSMIFPQFFTRMAPALGISLLATVFAEAIALLIFRMNVTLLDWVVVGIMSLYIAYDWVRANSVQRTAANAIAAASALYLDIINIFLRLLRILARSRNRD